MCWRCKGSNDGNVIGLLPTRLHPSRSTPQQCCDLPGPRRHRACSLSTGPELGVPCTSCEWNIQSLTAKTFQIRQQCKWNWILMVTTNKFSSDEWFDNVWRHLACHTWKVVAAGILWLGARDSATYPMRHKSVPQQWISQLKISIMLTWQNSMLSFNKFFLYSNTKSMFTKKKKQNTLRADIA